MKSNLGYSAVVASGCFLLVAGCSTAQPRLDPPQIDPAAAAAAAITEYDANHNGTIEGEELDKVPAFKSSLSLIDTNGDKMISAEEIAARLQAWKESRLALATCMCSVTMDGRPLVGAEVTFVPEAFLGPNVKTGKSVTKTSEMGMAIVTVDGVERNGVKLSGVSPGFYKVQVSKQDGGKELIPERYNAHTELGQEIASDVPAMQSGIKFAVKSH
jgi:hypothetical protein